MEKVLILNASHNDERMIKALKEMNFYVVSTGNRPNLPGHKMCDEYYPADYSDKEAILELAQKLKIDRICSCCNDFGVITSAYVAEKLHLPGHDPYQTTMLLHNKDLFKAFAKEHGIDTPPAEQFLNAEEAKQYVRSAQYPIIVKAVDLSAGNGILRAATFEEAYVAIDNAFASSRCKRIIIEPFITGSQHGLCTFLIDKKVAAYCSNDEYSVVNPYRVEIDTFPATDEEYTAAYLIEQIEKIADLLNLTDGCFHLQYITDMNRQPHIIECMRRIPGGLYTIPGESVSGVNWDYWEARARCACSLRDFPRQGHSNRGFFSYKCIMAETNGFIENIHLSSELMRHRYGEWWLCGKGSKIDNHMSTPIGFVFGSFASQEEMRKILIEDYQNSFVEMRTAESGEGLEK